MSPVILIEIRKQNIKFLHLTSYIGYVNNLRCDTSEMFSIQ